MAQSVATLKAMAVLDASGLINGLDLTKKEIREASRAAEASQGGVEKFANKLSLLERARAGDHISQSQYAKAASAAQMEMLRGIPVLGNFAGMLNPVTASLTLATAGLTAFTAGVGLMAHEVGRRIDEIDKLGDESDRLGMSITSLSRLSIAADLGDVKAESVTKFLEKMQVELGKAALGADDSRESFNKLGLDWNTLIDLDPARQFEQVAAAVNKLPTSSERLAALRDIGGKGGPEVAKFARELESLMRQADETGAVIAESLGGKVGDVDLATKKLGYAWDGVVDSVTSLVAGPLTTMLSLTRDVTNNAKAMGQTLTVAGGVLAGPTGAGLGAQFTDLVTGERDRLRREAAEAKTDKTTDHRAAAISAAEEAEERRSIKKKERDEEKATIDDLLAQRDHRFKEDMRRGEEEHRRELERLHELADERDKRFEKDRREAEEGRRILDTLRTPKEAIEGDLKEKLLALERSGLDSNEARGKLFGRAAKDMLGIEGGGFGAVGADKGTRAAREAVIGAGHQAEQTALLKRIEKHLEKIFAKPAIEVEEIS